MRRSFRGSELLLVLLRLLQRRPLPESEIFPALDRLLGGEYRLTGGAVFVAIEALEVEGLIEVAREGSAMYRATADGTEALRRRLDAPVLARVGDAAEPASLPKVSGSPKLERVTVLFTDIVGSTDLFDRVGDAGAHRLRHQHFALLRGALNDHAGREVKSLGDGLMVAFGGPRPAITCGLAMQRAVYECHDRLELRIGIASGEAMREDGDYFGRPVVVARRLCDAAAGGEILASEPLGDSDAALPGAVLEQRGTLALKGLLSPVAVSALRPQSLLLGL